MLSRDKLSEFAAWCHSLITGGEKGEAQILLDHLFQACGYVGGLSEAGATLEMRVSRAGANSIAPGVWWKYPDAEPLVMDDCLRPRA